MRKWMSILKLLALIGILFVVVWFGRPNPLKEEMRKAGITVTEIESNSQDNVPDGGHLYRISKLDKLRLMRILSSSGFKHVSNIDTLSNEPNCYTKVTRTFLLSRTDTVGFFGDYADGTHLYFSPDPFRSK